MKKVMVVAVHPDDETLGCGGTLLKHKQSGDQVAWTIVTTTEGNSAYSDDYRVQRDKDIATVAKGFAFDKTYKLDLPAGMVDQVTLLDRIEKLSKVINEFQPNIIYVPFMNDVHSDHRCTFDAVSACTKKFRYPFIEKVLMMEVVSETEYAPALSSHVFVPNVFSNISEQMKTKMQILDTYSEELGQHPFPRSKENVETLCRFRGSMAGCDYAESFMLLKEYV